ncbi:hypothetical protein KIPE111705_01875 [Kibdelosporangium persicum]|uniref:AAA domain-containing protein n=1 Tax=Kibdelosporangium persicum TaxID=2698649 RepID=A0ABX2FIF9_9PSEU|nr:hypothetical protein [Kibdelosporangium persicum]NRN71199.1 hypothetical protein [Kibdelosporangium persicum]
MKVYPGSWPVTVVCGASGTGRTRFAYALAARYNGHVIDTSDVLQAVRAMTGPEQYPELFHQDQPLAGTAEEVATARLRAADVLAPAVRAVITEQPRLRLDGFQEYPHTVVTGRHALPTLAWDFAVVLRETGEQIHANLAGRYPRDDSLDRRVRASMLVQDELVRRGREHNRTRCHVVFVDARPWSDAVDRARGEMNDRWDSGNALG